VHNYANHTDVEIGQNEAGQTYTSGFTMSINQPLSSAHATAAHLPVNICTYDADTGALIGCVNTTMVVDVTWTPNTISVTETTDRYTENGQTFVQRVRHLETEGRAYGTFNNISVTTGYGVGMSSTSDTLLCVSGC
jgi:hypothetical protein